MGFLPLQIYEYFLCYFRHDYIEQGLSLAVLLRNNVIEEGWADLYSSFWMTDRWAGLHAIRNCVVFYRFVCFIILLDT